MSEEDKIRCEVQNERKSRVVIAGAKMFQLQAPFRSSRFSISSVSSSSSSFSCAVWLHVVAILLYYYYHHRHHHHHHPHALHHHESTETTHVHTCYQYNSERFYSSSSYHVHHDYYKATEKILLLFFSTHLMALLKVLLHVKRRPFCILCSNNEIPCSARHTHIYTLIFTKQRTWNPKNTIHFHTNIRS